MTNKTSPPPYNQIDGKDDSQALETKQYPTPANINRTNFVKFFPPKGMKRVWVIDPSMKIPTTLLPPLSRGETEETRKNVELIAKGGDLDADIFILPASSVALTSSWKDISVTIHAASQTGWVNLRIVCIGILIFTRALICIRWHYSMTHNQRMPETVEFP